MVLFLELSPHRLDCHAWETNGKKLSPGWANSLEAFCGALLCIPRGIQVDSKPIKSSLRVPLLFRRPFSPPLPSRWLTPTSLPCPGKARGGMSSGPAFAQPSAAAETWRLLILRSSTPPPPPSSSSSPGISSLSGEGSCGAPFQSGCYGDSCLLRLGI